jgi:hypothetical protein
LKSIRRLYFKASAAHLSFVQYPLGCLGTFLLLDSAVIISFGRDGLAVSVLTLKQVDEGRIFSTLLFNIPEREKCTGDTYAGRKAEQLHRESVHINVTKALASEIDFGCRDFDSKGAFICGF